MPRGDFGIDLRAFSDKLQQDFDKASKMYTRWTKGLQAGAKKAAEPIGKVERNMRALAAQIRATDSVARRFALQFRRDLLNLSNIFVRRFTFTIATSIEQMALRVLRLPLDLLRQIISVGSEFENSVLKTAAVTAGGVDGLREAFVKVAEAAQTLGRESIFTAVEVASAMFELASVGLNVEEQFLAIKASANFAAAAQTDLMTATNLLTQIMKSYGLQGEDLAGISDILTFAFNTTTVNVERLVQAMKFAAPAGAAFGVDFADVTAIVAGFVDVTKQGGISGRAFRFMLAALGNPSQKAREAIEALGLTLESVDPRFTSLADILENFARTSLTASDAMVIFGKRAGPVVMSFIKRFRIGLAAGINQLTQFRENLDLEKNVNLAAKQAGIFRESVTNQFRLLVSKATDLLIRLFFKFEENFRDMLTFGSKVIDKLSDKFDDIERGAGRAREQVRLLGLSVGILGSSKVIKGTVVMSKSLGGAAIAGALASTAVSGLKRKTVVFLQALKKASPVLVRFIRFFIGKGGIIATFLVMLDVFGKASEATGGVGKVLDRLGISIALARTAIEGLTSAYSTFTSFAATLVMDTVSAVMQQLLELTAKVLTLSTVLSKLTLLRFTKFPEEAKKAAESLRLFSADLAVSNIQAQESLRIRRETTVAEVEALKKKEDLRDAMTKEIGSMETFESKQIALFTGFMNLRNSGETFKASLNLLADEIDKVALYSENTGNAMFTWFEMLPEGVQRIRAGTVELGALEGQTKATAASFRDFLNKQLGIFNKIVILPRDTLNRIEEAYDALTFIGANFTGQIRLQMVKSVRSVLNDYVKELQEARSLTAVEIEALLKIYKTFPTQLGYAFQDGEEIIFAFATEATLALENIPDKVDKKEVKSKSRDIFNSISREFGTSIADMLVNAESFVEAMLDLMEGLFADTMFNLFRDFTSVFESTMVDGIETKGLTGIKALGAGWGKFREGLTADGGVFNSILAGFSAMSGSIAGIAFAGFNAILQFMQGNWLAGIMSVAGIVVGIFAKLWGKDTIEEAAKGLQTMLKSIGEISLDVAKEVQELAKELKDAGEKGASLAAIAASLGKILSDTGIPTMASFAAATQELIYALERAQQGLFDEKFAIQGVTEAFPILLENMDKMGSVGAANIRRIIELTRAMGLEIDVVTDFVREMTNQAAEGMNALAGSIETLTDQQLKTLGESFNTIMSEMIANGASILDIIDSFGPLIDAARDAGIDLGGNFKILLSITRKLQKEGVAPIVAQMQAWRDIMQSISNLGLLTEENFSDFGDSIMDSYRKLRDSGFTIKESLLLSAGTLAEIIALSEKYGFELSDEIKKLIEIANKKGIILEKEETLMDVMKDIRDVLTDMRDVMKGVGDAGVDSFDRIKDAGINAGDEVEDYWKNIDLTPGAGLPGGGHHATGEPPGYARGGVVPPTPSGSLIARVHQNEIIGAPEQIVAAVQTALAKLGGGALGGGDVVYAPTIDVRLGRRILRQAVKEVIERGTIDGDIAVNSDSVFFFT